jgi:MoaA/NifB/PqqE/SkfB family radical SAM enzyme
MIAVIKETLGRLYYILPSMPDQVQIEITNQCNLDCNMCPREDLGVEFKHMRMDLFKRIIDCLNGVRLITLTGWGEPFMHPHIFDMIEICKKKGIEVQLTTNGVFFNDSILKKIISSELDSISFSMDSLNGSSKFGHKNNDAQKNIIKLLKARNGCKPKVTIQSTLQKNGEEEIYNLIQWGSYVGIDRVNLGRLDQRFNEKLTRPSREEEKEIVIKANKLGKKCGIEVDCIHYSVGKGIQKEIYKILKNALHCFGKYCLKTYTYVYINLYGDVTPCCGLPRYKIDNILQKELKDIWHDKKFIEFREKQTEICGKCDLWNIKYLS